MTKPTVDAKTTTEYAEGRQAFLDEKPNKVCPYDGHGRGNNERYRWFAGWFDAKYKPLFDRLDATWGL
ncbi:hypothetical protein LCGC14_0643400 [marine sediment metagenome]|uniref:Uncharacterized protein n=1 Tax=marine sediment metagenome TaxID=412755 RepID=A0A0F9R3L7_9ZZZZ